MKNLFVLVLFLVLIIPVKSQNLQIVKEINPNNISYNGLFLNESNGKIFFTANDGNSTQVWVTDGSDEGTFAIKEGSLGRRGEHRLQNVFSFNNKSYFIIKSEAFPQADRLYESDGTEAGTLKVSDLTFNKILGAFSDKLFLYKRAFSSNEAELWVLDKNETNPVFIKKTGDSYSSSYILLFTEYKNKFYFADTETDGSVNYELWVSDGTPGGTVKLKEINPEKSSYPSRFLVYNDKLYFLAQSDINKFTADLWRTDGTEQGTIKVGTTTLSLTSIADNHSIYKPKSFIFNGKMYFSDYAQVWESDGTDAGTKVFSSDKRAVGILNNQFLMAKENQKEQLLYISDENAANTRQIANLQVTEDQINTFSVGKMEVLNNRAYIMTTMYSSLSYNVYSYLWETDGTAAGTRLITPYKSFYGNPLPNFYYSPVYSDRIAVLNGEVYFPYLADENEGFELYKYSFSPATFAKDVEKAEIRADVYPNPLQDILNISLSERKINSIQLLNLNGQIIENHNPESNASSYRFSVQNYKSGIYILKIIDEEGVVYNKRVFKK